MKSKKKIRERPIDYKKQFLIIKDLNYEKERAAKENLDQLIELNNIEKDLNKVFEYYDKKIKFQIPKGKIINEKNNKDKERNNYYINNNIVYNTDNENNNSKGKDYNLNYNLSEYKRPNNYIIYSSLERDRINMKKREYEAKEADYIFLKIRGNIMNINELENIILDLENNVTNNKNDKIDEEKAKNIIETKYSNYKNYADSIINHFKDRRNTIKNSLVRKNWRRDKTFQLRKTNKIKTRKSITSIKESLNQIVEAEKLCKYNLFPLLINLFFKETLNKNSIKLNEYMFLSECSQITNTKIEANIIKNNKIIKENILNISKIIGVKEENPEPPSVPPPPPIKKIEKMPDITLDILKDENNDENEETNYLNNKSNKYRIRIRINRSNNITIDRYIQLKNDFHPFHDSFNQIINNYKKFSNHGKYVMDITGGPSFNSLLDKYYLDNICKEILLDENDDDSLLFKNDIKQFSNSYKQFLQLKRANT